MSVFVWIEKKSGISTSKILMTVVLTRIHQKIWLSSWLVFVMLSSHWLIKKTLYQFTMRSNFFMKSDRKNHYILQFYKIFFNSMFWWVSKFLEVKKSNTESPKDWKKRWWIVMKLTTWSLLQCQKRIVIYYVKKLAKKSQ